MEIVSILMYMEVHAIMKGVGNHEVDFLGQES